MDTRAWKLGIHLLKVCSVLSIKDRYQNSVSGKKLRLTLNMFDLGEKNWVALRAQVSYSYTILDGCEA